VGTRRVRQGAPPRADPGLEWHESIEPAEWKGCCARVSARLKALVDGADQNAGVMIYAAVQQVASVLRSVLVHELGSRSDVERPVVVG
jgi:hypothetical protein